jgi:gliding motility-associated-like protein
MNLFKKHLQLLGFVFFTLMSLSNFATNTISVHSTMADSVRLYATRTTTTIPNFVNIDITIGGFVDIKEFNFNIEWDATKLQYSQLDKTYVSAFSTAIIDDSNAVTTGKIHISWVGSPLILVDGTQIFRLRFYASVPSATPIPINFTDDVAPFVTTFKNSSNQIVPWAGSYGQVRIVNCTQINPSLRCSTATLLCGKDLPVCGRLPTSNVQDNPGQFISCGNIQNNVWMAFIAASDSLKLKIKASNCNGGGVGGNGDGIQMSILETNNCLNYLKLACKADLRNGEEFIVNVSETGALTIGKQYYIMLDGVSADVCDFQIDIMEGSISSSSITPPSVTGASTACANQTGLAFSIPAQPSALGYLWKIAGNSATILNGSSTPSVNVNWGTVSDSICVRVVGRCDTTLWSCKAVAIGTRTVRDTTVEKCATAVYRFDNKDLVNASSYTATFRSATGCDSVVNLILVNYPTATRTLDSTVCIGSSVRIGTTNYSVADTYTIVLPNASYRGCDSTVTLKLSVIESALNVTPQNGVLTCETQTIALNATYVPKPANANATFEWTNSTGQVIGTNTTVTVSQPGAYKFKLTLSLNGVSCSQDRTINVTRTGVVPAKPDLTGVIESCSGSPELYKINNPVSGITYNWRVTGGVFPNGGASQINVNWNANAVAALVCVDAQNGCGKSDSICKMVDIAKIPDPLSMTGDATVCPNATVTYSVPATSNATNYQWTVTNGTITSGQGTPLLTVTWGATTTGRVCLTTSNRCGTAQVPCKDIQIKNTPPDSIPIQGATSVCSQDTTVYSSAASGVTQFNWEVPIGATILRGQGTNTVLVVWGALLGNATVGLTTTNACNLTRKVTLNINIKNAALTAPVISGTATVCPMSRANYSIPSDATITAYKWTVPSGATIVGTSTSSAILVDWGSATGVNNVCIEIQNSCNIKKSTCFAVEVKATLDSLPLTGPTLACKDSIVFFEVQNDPNAVGYVWALPVGSTIASGLNTYRIGIKLGANSGNVRVVPFGGCADGQVSRRYITVKTPPAAPGNISGTTTLCEGTTGVFSIPVLSEVTAYQWQIPAGARIVGDSTGNQITLNLGNSTGGSLRVRGVNGCGVGAWSATANIFVVTKPIVNAGNDTIVCGLRATLRGRTTAAIQTWSIVDRPIGANFSILNSFDTQTDVTVTKAGIYVFKLESNNATGCDQKDSVQIEFKELPNLIVVSENCNLEATQYRVALNILGTASSYTMLGSVSGIFSTNNTSVFTTNTIPNGTPYILMAKDNFGCVSNEVRGVKNCPCYTSAGALRADSVVVCFGTAGQVNVLNDARLDGSDSYQFILHNGTANTRGTVLKKNKTGVFNAATLQLNRVYYIAYVVGDSLADGSVDLTHSCTSSSLGIPIVFKGRLTAGITGDTTICRFDNAALHFNVNQIGVYNITLRGDNGTRFINNVFSGQSLSVTPSFSTTYKLLEVKDDNGCVAELTDSTRVNLKPLPISNAGADRSVCQTSATLDAAENLQYVGKWTSLTPNVRILTPSDHKSGVESLQNGRNVLVWAVADTTCPNYTVRDTVQIFLPLLPKANTLSLVTYVGQPVSGTVNENAPNGTYTITRLTNPPMGSFALFSNGSFTYRPDTSFTGIVKFKFAICSDLCNQLCDTGEVRILIKPKPLDTLAAEIDMPNAITPNGDGKNDVLKIDGIEKYPNNELVIFNRWGDILYKAKPYLNDWQGVNQSGGELPEGTYYYVLRLNVNDGKILRGNMTVLR